MTDTQKTNDKAAQPGQARDLQARLYREIGISAVAAALQFASLPDPGKQAPKQHPTLPLLRDDDMAA